MSDQLTQNDLPDFLQPGFEAEIGSHTFTAEEIIRFAKAYDPQPFHVDAEAAKSSLFGGLCASGWHTASVWMRKQRDFAARRETELLKANPNATMPEFGPSPGFSNLKWVLPVYAGQTVTYSNRNIGIRKSGSKPGWWLLSVEHQGHNEAGKRVITFESVVFLKFQ